MAKEIVEKDLPRVSDLCNEILGQNYKTISRMGGLTNHSYHIVLENGKEYVVRIPGDGTEELIVRKDEKVSTLLACELNIDANLLYFGEDGAKVTEYVSQAVTMSPEELQKEENIKKVSEIFKTLHNCGKDTKVPFEVFDMAKNYEKIITENSVALFDDYEEIKNEVFKVKSEIDSMFGINKVPCHNDSLCENWVMDGSKRMYLIDWEYAGMNDGWWDLADVSIEALYSEEEDTKLLKFYLNKDPDSNDWKHLLAGKVYVDYLWTLWAKTRVPYDGKPMEDWAAERYARLKSNLNKYKKF